MFHSGKRIVLQVSIGGSIKLIFFLPLFSNLTRLSGDQVIAWTYEDGSDISKLLSAGKVIFSTMRKYESVVSNSF